MEPNANRARQLELAREIQRINDRADAAGEVIDPWRIDPLASELAALVLANAGLITAASEMRDTLAALLRRCKILGVSYAWPEFDTAIALLDRTATVPTKETP